MSLVISLSLLRSLLPRLAAVGGASMRTVHGPFAGGVSGACRRAKAVRSARRARGEGATERRKRERESVAANGGRDER